MATTITLTDVNILSIHIDYQRQAVRVRFILVDSAGKAWEEMDAIFWVTVPALPPVQGGESGQVPDTWFQLPETYITAFVNLMNDAKATLKAKFIGA